MAQAPQDSHDLTKQFIEFFRRYYREEIGTLAQRYPNEKRSLFIDYDDLYTFDADLAADYRREPDQLTEYAEEALRLYDLPADVKLGRAHVRMENLPSTVDIRSIRVHDDHISRLIAVQGIVRKATDVRPKITEAAFECQRCGTMTYISQADTGFQEPHECQGCERQGPFHIDFDQSEFIDAQKIRVQESPEGLRGGETPQSIDIDLEDDITGQVTAGDHVTVNGILHIEQQTERNEKTPIFDLYMDGVSLSIEDEEFEDMQITDDDIANIIELSNDEDIYEKMVDSVAPSIYGYEDEKLAMILQLFSGVTKHLPDGSRIRGDLHMLLIGDPGTGKCVDGDTLVSLADGSETPIRELVEANLESPKRVDDGVWDRVNIAVPSMRPDGSFTTQQATRVWKREAPEQMFQIQTTGGTQLTVTPSHPLFVVRGGTPTAIIAANLEIGQSVAVANTEIDCTETDTGARTLQSPLSDGGITVEQITAIEAVDPAEEWVYDLEIAQTHSYITNKIVSHNSAMLQYIRNIAPRSVYTSGKGSSSAGLCVTGDTRIHTKDGFIRIRNLVEQKLPDPVSVETSATDERGVYTLDQGTQTIESTQSSHIWRMPEKLCRRVETARGKELELSVNTPVLVRGQDQTQWKAVKHVEPGEYIAAPQYRGIERSDPPIDDFIEYTGQETELLLDEKSAAYLRDRLIEAFETPQRAAASLGLSEETIQNALACRPIAVGQLDHILSTLGESREEITVSRARASESDEIRIPRHFDTELLYLTGLIFAEGEFTSQNSVNESKSIRIFTADETLLERAATIINSRFDIDVEIQATMRNSETSSIHLDNPILLRFFENLGLGVTQETSELDARLTNASNIDAFVQGLMDAKASLSSPQRSPSRVQLRLNSDSLAIQIQLILETYGIKATRRSRGQYRSQHMSEHRTNEEERAQYYIQIPEQSVARYAEVINFRSTTKHDALAEMVAASNIHENDCSGESTQVIGIDRDGGNGLLRQQLSPGDQLLQAETRPLTTSATTHNRRGDTEATAEADVAWERVVTAVDIGPKEVFDLTVPSTHNFIGNGIVTHNTAAAVRDDFGDGQQWTLEAGALVLADKGTAAVDELDKMRCVTGDTLVHLADGSLRRIRDIADEAAQTGQIESLSNGRTIRDTDIETHVWTMSDEGTLIPRPITAIHKYEAPEALIQVTLASGETVTCTADHPFFILEDGERSKQPAKSLAPGELTIVPTQLSPAISDGGVDLQAGSDMHEGGIDSYPSPALAAIFGYMCTEIASFSPARAESDICFSGYETGLQTPLKQNAQAAFEAVSLCEHGEVHSDDSETIQLTAKGVMNELSDAGIRRDTVDSRQLIETVTTGCQKARQQFIRALADVNGKVTEQQIQITSTHRELLLGVQQLLTAFTVSASVRRIAAESESEQYELVIADQASIRSFERLIGFTMRRKQRAIASAAKYDSEDNPRLSDIDGLSEIYASIRESLRLDHSECGIAAETYRTFETNETSLSVQQAHDVIESFEQRVQEAHRQKPTLQEASLTELLTLADEYHLSVSEFANQPHCTQQQIQTRSETSERLLTAVRNQLSDILATVSSVNLDGIRSIVEGDVRCCRIEDVSTISAATGNDQRKYVYDLTVKETHNFVANGIVVHNSEDRSAMHEALEQQSYHPQSEILLADGRRINIGPFVDTLMQKSPEQVTEGVDCELLPTDDIDIHTVDFETNDIRKTSVDRVSRHAAPDRFIRVSFSNGRSVTVTPEHPMFVEQGGEIETTAAENMSINDRVPAPRQLPDTEDSAMDGKKCNTKPSDIDRSDDLSPVGGEILGILIATEYFDAHTHPPDGALSDVGADVLSRLDSLLERTTEGTESPASRQIETRRQREEVLRRIQFNLVDSAFDPSSARIPRVVLAGSETIIRRFLVGAFAVNDTHGSDASTFSATVASLAEDYADALLKLGISSQIQHDASMDVWKTVVEEHSRKRFTECIADVVNRQYDRPEHLGKPVNAGVETTDNRLPIYSTSKDKLSTQHTGTNVNKRRQTNCFEANMSHISPDCAGITVPKLRATDIWPSQQCVGRRPGSVTDTPHQCYSGESTAPNRQAHSARWNVADTNANDADTCDPRSSVDSDSALQYYHVTNIETIPNQGPDACEWVYDITVEPTHTFISQGVVLHNSISVSKAGINATLKSRCSLLGAANPKYGRFDQYESIGEQIDLEPALISRFDLIFTVTDNPDPERDAELAEHIINTNYAGELHTQKSKLPSSEFSENEVDSATEEVTPEIEAELLRKYVAYAKRNCYPTMTDAAKEVIREFYVDFRAKGADEDSPVPVTARKLEALVRLSEASARLRLSDTVDKRDALRVTDIVESCLRDIGMDPETGEFDADIVETGTSKSQRDRIKNLLHLIEALETEYESGAPYEEVVEQAESELGLTETKTEEQIEDLKRKGELYEPQMNTLRTT
jgi:replicative DNA helicase Mcm